MAHTRRRFLKYLAVGTVGTAAVMVTAGKLYYRPLRNWLFRLGADVEPGLLDVSTLRTQLAVVDTLIGAEFESNHYQEFFLWHAANSSGYRGLYVRTAGMLNELAAPLGHRFADLAFDARRRIIDELLGHQSNKLRKLWMTIMNRDAVLFGHRIVAPILDLYRETDAWIHLGYEAWPGQPRGLIDYTRAPRQRRQTPRNV